MRCRFPSRKEDFPRAGGRTFQSVVIKVPYGKEVALSLHSCVKSQDLAKMQLFSRISSSVVELAAKRRWLRSQPLDSSEIEGRLADLPATTIVPPRKLTLVNAIQRPYKLPTITSLVPRGRGRGSDTFQAFNDVQIDVERASTAETISLISSWDECRDGNETSKPTRIFKTEVPVCEATIQLPLSFCRKRWICTPLPGTRARCVLKNLWRNGRWNICGARVCTEHTNRSLPNQEKSGKSSAIQGIA